MSRNLALTTVALVGIVLAMIVGAFFVSWSTQDTFITIGIIGTSIAAGAIIGTAVAPFNEEEGQKFSNYTKAASIFVTGYIASKVDALVNKFFDPLTYAGMSTLWSFRLVAALAVGLSVAKLTFAFRSYGYGNAEAQRSDQD